MPRILGRILAAALLAASPVLPALALEPPGNAPGPKVGEPAPAFDLPTIDGGRITLAALRGKTVVLNAWATWCPPCRQETPDLVAAHKALGGKDVVFVGIDSTEQAPLVKAFVATKNVGWTQAIDADKSFSKAYDIRYFPTTFVIDPQGILRMAYIDVVTVKLLSGFVDDARAGRNARIASPAQTKIDALLDPARYPLSGDEAAIDASVGRIRKAIEQADKMVDESDAAAGNPVDLPRTQAEENALRDAAIAALSPLAKSDARTAVIDLLKGDADWYDGQYAAALTAYQAAAARDPKNADALGGVAQSARRLKQFDTLLGADAALVALEPSDVGNRVQLAIDYGSAGKFAEGRTAFDAAVALAAKSAKAPGAKPADVRRLAWAHLYYGRMEAKAGATARAKRQFALATETALRLPKKDPRHDVYLEQAQEESVALDLGTGTRAATALSLAPWTGPELPGSSTNTAKYRLVVAGPQGGTVSLRATDLPKRWIASFCTDRICAPLRVTTKLPASGVKVIEFQLVPPDAKGLSHLPIVRIVANDGKSTTTVRTVALR